MNMLQVAQTKAEQSFAEYYENLRKQLPGNGRTSEIRDGAMEFFSRQGLPHRRVEDWKYTDLRRQMGEAFKPSIGKYTEIALDDSKLEKIKTSLESAADVGGTRLVFVNGSFSETLSSLQQGQDGLEILSLSNALEKPDDWLVKILEVQDEGQAQNADLKKSGPVSRYESDKKADQHLGRWGDILLALNWGFMNDGAVIRVNKRNTELEGPEQQVHIVHVTVGDQRQLVTTRNIIVVEDQAEVSLVESFLSADETEFQSNDVTQLFIGNDAKVDHVKIQLQNDNTFHLSTWIVKVGSKAVYQAAQFTAGAHLSRNQLFVDMEGDDAIVNINGAYLLKGVQHCDTRLVVDHARPGCESRELFKCVLDDQSKGVFQGKLVVRPCAQKTDGKQMAQALLLGQGAEFDSKPELEIYADDVACGHGSTSGQIDEDLLFYLNARGIPDDQAQTLLITAFIGEAIEAINNEQLRDTIMNFTSDWLSKGLN